MNYEITLYIKKGKIYITLNECRWYIEANGNNFYTFCTLYSYAMQNDNYPLSLFSCKFAQNSFSLFVANDHCFISSKSRTNVYKRKQQHAIHKNRSLHISLFRNKKERRHGQRPVVKLNRIWKRYNRRVLCICPIVCLIASTVRKGYTRNFDKIYLNLKAFDIIQN